ncbi:MAG TPA: hypothetical protein VIJ34_05765 [Acidimicrobiales bacterium]
MAPVVPIHGADPGTEPRSRCSCWCHREFLTVIEAARVVAISRAQAYELAADFRRTDGREGLPVIAIGHALRVPVTRLRQWSGMTEPTTLCNRCGHALRAEQAS